MRWIVNLRKRIASLGLPGLVLLLLSCGPSGPEMARVSGKVTFQGKPLTGGAITFQSTDAKRPNATSPIGQDGSYSLQTTSPGDGAQLGQYRVAISDADTEKILDYIPKTPVVKKPTIPAKYADPNNSGLEATVTSGGNSIPFDLK